MRLTYKLMHKQTNTHNLLHIGDVLLYNTTERRQQVTSVWEGVEFWEGPLVVPNSQEEVEIGEDQSHRNLSCRHQ